MDDILGYLLCVAGRMGSGKSTLAEAIGRRLGWPSGSFGEYVRSTARARGLAQDRQTLQNLGASLLSQNIDGFCRAVLGDAGWDSGQSVVLEGVRHIEVLDCLRHIASPGPVALIFIDVPEDERRKRLEERSGELDIEKAQEHSTEAQADLLREAADLVVLGREKPSVVETRVLRFVNDWTAHPSKRPSQRCKG